MLQKIFCRQGNLVAEKMNKIPQCLPNYVYMYSYAARYMHVYDYIQLCKTWIFVTVNALLHIGFQLIISSVFFFILNILFCSSALEKNNNKQQKQNT